MDKRPYPQKARDRVKAGKLQAKLQQHALGKCEMSATQIRAAEILLKKVWPDLKQSEQHHTGDVKYEVIVSAEADDELDEKLESEY